MGIISIQSHVVYGHAGNSSAVFPLQRLGFETWAVNTVEFSNHSGYGGFSGAVLGADLAEKLLDGIAARGALERTEALLSGYVGDAGTGRVIARAADRVKQASPGALYCCDPVMGDTGRGYYVKPGVPDMIKNELVPRADIVTPNQFELESLTGVEAGTIEGARRAITALHAMGPKIVLVTSTRFNHEPHEPHERGESEIGLLASNGTELFAVSTPEIPLKWPAAGAGDLTAAIFLARCLSLGGLSTAAGVDLRGALGLCAASVWAVIKATADANDRELHIVAAQDEIAAPSRRFTVETL